MSNNLTDRNFWKNYWKNYQYEKVSDKLIYNKYIDKLNKNERFIEIGGFPGINAVALYKRGFKDLTILDFYIDDEIINGLENKNGLPVGTIRSIESDFFKMGQTQKYDIVFSNGFIEHFEDTKDVIKRHVDILNDKGNLLLVLPNLRGVNGWIQFLFDKRNYDAHNLNAMNLSKLKIIAKELGLKDIEINYTSKPMVWLEPRPGMGNKILREAIHLFSLFLKLFPFKCRLLSPYIIIFAKKYHE